MENNVYKIRVVADTEEDIFIDLMALKNCNLLQLHELLTEEFSLNKLEMACKKQPALAGILIKYFVIKLCSIKS